MMELTIIIPVYNAAAFIENSLKRLKNWLAGRKNFELIIVNDGSQDDTQRILEVLQNQVHNYKILSFVENRGKGFVLRKAIEQASGNYVAFTDADLPYGLEAFDRMLEKLKKDARIFFLYGSRSHSLSKEKRGYDALRRFGRKFFSVVIRTFVTPDVLDTQCGIKMFTKEFAQFVSQRAVIDRFAQDIEFFVIAKANHWQYQDFPVEFDHRKESSVRLIWDTLIMLKDVIRIKLNFMLGKYRK